MFFRIESKEDKIVKEGWVTSALQLKGLGLKLNNYALYRPALKKIIILNA